MSQGTEDRPVRALLVNLLAVTVSGSMSFALIAAVMHFATR